MGLLDFFKDRRGSSGGKVSPSFQKPARSSPVEAQDYIKGAILADQYKIKGILGRGGFSVVYSAISLNSGEPVAIKALRYSGDSQLNRDFEAELKIWLGLGNHPFIVSLNHVFYHAGRLHAVMEYVAASSEGTISLHDIIVQGVALSDQSIGDYCIQFCAAMKYASEKGLRAHRDIKPMNLLIDAGSRLKISDFGLAWAAERLDVEMGVGGASGRAQRIISLNGRVTVGTPGFIAPELIKGDFASVASDIFSFGVVLWQMATGRAELPYRVPNANDLEEFNKAMFEAQVSKNWREVPSIYWPVIERCLQPDLVLRYKDYNQLLTHIKQIMRDHGLRTLDYFF